MPGGTRRQLPKGRKTTTRRKTMRTTKKRVMTSKSKISSSFRDRVKRIVSGMEETKYVTEALVTNTTFNSVVTDPSDWYRCLPQLAQSSENTSYTREGKIITPTDLTVHWNFRFATTDANTRDIFVVLYILQPKFQKASRRTDVNNQVSFYNSSYLDNGLGTKTNFAGDWLTSQYPVEKSLFTLLHKRVFRLSKASGSSNGAGVVGQYDSYGRGMYAIGIQDNINHQWSHKLPKLNYDDGQYNSVTNPDVACVLPQNTSPVWAVGYYYADGTAADTAGGILNVSCWTEMSFKDD